MDQFEKKARQLAAGQPLHRAFFPPIVGPGDDTFYLPGTIRCMDGYWHGEAQARLLDAGGSGFSQNEPPVTTNPHGWNNKESMINPA